MSCSSARRSDTHARTPAEVNSLIAELDAQTTDAKKLRAENHKLREDVALYWMATPALVKTLTELTRVAPKAVPETTSNKRVPSVTGMASPVSIPELMVPMAATPVRAGARVTTAPGIGVKVLSGVVDSYSWAVSTNVVPARTSATVVLAKALIDVIVPFLGMEKAMSGTVVASITTPEA
jgi:hypothetical protein